MKHIYKFMLLLIFSTMSINIFAQSADNEDEVIKIDESNYGAYRPNEVIVHFKEDGAVQMRAPRRTKFQTTAVSAIDQLFESLGVDSVEELMPRTGTRPMPKKVRTFNGKDIEPKPLGKLYRLKLAENSNQNVFQAIEQLKQLEEVDYAEPNYLVFALGAETALEDEISLPIYSDKKAYISKSKQNATNDSAIYVQEPLYSQQWGIEAINLHKLWNKPKITTKRPVIAILDTGVDIEHPDLAANIWTNETEANGIDGQDDDANGFKDDIHGWDFINQTGIIRDFNGHGTHCAGIAAAVGDNGIGITGANPDALIMPITILQSTGTGDIATIVKGVDYAAANGADVISMSIGTYQYSLALEQSLGRAYANAVLVAAAGNNACCFEGCDHCPDVPSFPGGFTFVLGVEATTDVSGNLAGFSNYDKTGPIFSIFGEESLYNYELRAPGVNIISTFPSGRYKYLNGTSMACPLVAGSISRMLQIKEVCNKETLFGDLIHTRKNDTQGNIDMCSAYNVVDENRKPTLWLVGYRTDDFVDGDGDRRLDAGETIEFYPIIRNDWGLAENIHFWFKKGFDFGGDWMEDDTTLITCLTDTVLFEHSLSAYAKNISANPFLFRINPDCTDGRQINMTLCATCDNSSDTLSQTIVFEIENGIELKGMITEDMTLYPNVHYIVTQKVAIRRGVTLTIEPGTVLKFKDGSGISIEYDKNDFLYKEFEMNGNIISMYYINPTCIGHVVAKGTPDSMIVFTKADGEQGLFSLDFGMREPSFPENEEWIYNSESILDTIYKTTTMYPLEYVKIERMRNRPCLNNVFLSNSIIRDFGESETAILQTSIAGMLAYKCIIDNVYSDFSLLTHRKPTGNMFISSNIANNLTQNAFYMDDEGGHTRMINSNMFVINSKTSPYLLYNCSSVPRTIEMHPNYYGSAKESIIRKYIYDIENNWSNAYFDISNKLTRPSAEAHGIVWRISVDGFDAQDEFELMPPIGVGTHKCEVYFNRPMDISVTPFVSYGVRPPYTQHVVNDSGSWSTDSTIYTAYFTVDGKTVSDGINRFYVADAQDDEHFKIPIEDFRFKMEIAAAGSMSTGLMAEAGLGKITLTWETDEEDFEDLLGYNLYRWSDDTMWINSVEYKFDTICINSILIDASDSIYIDYDVMPGKDYYYVIRQMTTSLESYDLSNAVVARPLTAIKGDANGSMSVDVADVITEVNYITHQNPQPFIFEAADVNSDNAINIFDVVGTINIIRHPEAQSNAVQDNKALYYIENGILYVETDVVLGGVQFTFTVDSPHVFTPLDALNGFEMVSEWTNSENYLFMAYSMSGKTIGVGKNALLQIGDAELTSIALSDTQGHNVNAIPRASTALDGTVFMPNSSKYIQDGNFFIKLGDRIYNAIGTLIK